MATMHTYSTALLGRAPMPVLAVGPSIVANHVPARAVPAAVSAATSSAATSTRDAASAHAVTAATWLGGSGFADGMGFGSISVACESTIPTNSTKRIHPGRLEAMT